MKCPNCGSPVHEVNTINTEYYNDSYYDSTCPDCGKSWSWVEVFTFDHYEDLEETEIDAHL